MTFITSDPTAIYRHALNAWVSPLATCALPKGVCYLLTYLLFLHAFEQNMNFYKWPAFHANHPATIA